MLQKRESKIRQKLFVFLISRTICDSIRAVRLVNFINSKEKKTVPKYTFYKSMENVI